MIQPRFVVCDGGGEEGGVCCVGRGESLSLSLGGSREERWTPTWSASMYRRKRGGRMLRWRVFPACFLLVLSRATAVPDHAATTRVVDAFLEHTNVIGSFLELLSEDKVGQTLLAAAARDLSNAIVRSVPARVDLLRSNSLSKRRFKETDSSLLRTAASMPRIGYNDRPPGTEFWDIGSATAEPSSACRGKANDYRNQCLFGRTSIEAGDYAG